MMRGIIRGLQHDPLWVKVMYLNLRAVRRGKMRKHMRGYIIPPLINPSQKPRKLTQKERA